MNSDKNQYSVKPVFSNTTCWRLWLLNTILVSASLWFLLACQYGTFEFFGTACLMALLPLIPVLVLVGGAGSSIFILTKVRIEKHSLKIPAALASFAGPGLAVSLLCVFLALTESPARRLAYICHGHAPASASHVQITGYSTFLGEEWLAEFNISQKDFQLLVAQTELAPADGFEFETILQQSVVKRTKLSQIRLPSQNLLCFKRIFNPATEHDRGRIYALFDPSTSTVVIFRYHHD